MNAAERYLENRSEKENKQVGRDGRGKKKELVNYTCHPNKRERERVCV